MNEDGMVMLILAGLAFAALILHARAKQTKPKQRQGPRWVKGQRYSPGGLWFSSGTHYIVSGVEPYVIDDVRWIRVHGEQLSAFASERDLSSKADKLTRYGPCTSGDVGYLSILGDGSGWGKTRYVVTRVGKGEDGELVIVGHEVWPHGQHVLLADYRAPEEAMQVETEESAA